MIFIHSPSFPISRNFSENTLVVKGVISNMFYIYNILLMTSFTTLLRLLQKCFNFFHLFFMSLPTKDPSPPSFKGWYYQMGGEIGRGRVWTNRNERYMGQIDLRAQNSTDQSWVAHPLQRCCVSVCSTICLKSAEKKVFLEFLSQHSRDAVGMKSAGYDS